MLSLLHREGGTSTLMATELQDIRLCGLPENQGSLSTNGSHEPHQRMPRKALAYGQIDLRTRTAMLRLGKRPGLLDTGDPKRQFVLEAGIRPGHAAMLATARFWP